MAKFIKRKVAIGVGSESSRGVGVASSYTIPFTDVTFDDKADKARSGESFGSISGEGNQSIVVSRKSEGVIETEMNVKSLPLILKSTFGALSTGASGDVYKHTLTLLESNQHPTMSLHIYDPIGSTIFKGCAVDTFEFVVKPMEIVSQSIGLKGKKGGSDTFTPSQITDYKFVGRDLELKIADNTAGLGAASAISVKELKVVINKNAEFDYALGTLEPEDIVNKQFSIKGEITLNYTDRVFRDYMLNGDYKAIGIKLTNTRDTIGAASNNVFYLEIPRVDFSEWETNGKLDEILGQKITFTALYDVATSKLISDCYVINSVVSY